MHALFLVLSSFILLLSPSSYAQDFLFDRPICTGLGDRVGVMLTLAALARVNNATIGFQWCKDPSVIIPAQRRLMPLWHGFDYNFTEFKARFRPPSDIIFVSDLSTPALQRLPKVVWEQGNMPFPAEQGSDSIPNIAWLTMRLPTPARLDYIDSFQAHYRDIVAPIAAAQPGAGIHGPFILLHMRGPDDNTFKGALDSSEHYCTGKVVKTLLKQKLGMPIYAISNNIPWADELLEGRVEILEDTGSAYDHFSLLISAKAIIQHGWGGWSSYSAVPALISVVPMINTYDPALPNHRFRLFKSQLGLPTNFYDCTQIPEFTQAIVSRTMPYIAFPSIHDNPASLLYTHEGHQHLVHSSLRDRGLAPLTRWTQAFIHRNQFVPDCSQRRFTVFHGWDSGFGSEMHVIGAILAYAIEHNTTLLLTHKACKFFASPALCKLGCECVLAPISNCKHSKVSPSSMHVVENQGHQFRYMVPSALRAELLAHHPRMTDKQVLYWWRAQSSAFIARFNNKTIQAVAALRQQELPSPLPPGVINAHIRSGDKHYEMRLVPPNQFVDAAASLAARMPNALGEHTLLIASDDSLAVQEGVRLGEASGFNVLVARKGSEPGGHVHTDWLKLEDRLTPFYGHLLQLTLALEADAWIGTRGSNWNRLIDELRCVWVDKCQHPYVEVGDEPLGSYSW
jgi:hypothetical protein